MTDLFDALHPPAADTARSISHAAVGTRTAEFSPCRRWRYTLVITWAAQLPTLVVLMLNPSTADEAANDPTVERCERRARNMGFGRLIIINLYAARSTDPRALYKGADPVGADNNRWIAWAADQARDGGMLLAGWGTHGAKVQKDRPAEVMALVLADGPIDVRALIVNADGSPGHPLYIGYDKMPEPFVVAA